MNNARIRSNKQLAKRIWNVTSAEALRRLKDLTITHGLSIASGHLLFLNNIWYVTHAGLLSIAAQKRCYGIHVSPELAFSNTANSRWAFKATVYRTAKCRGFVGYGDADPSNVSPLVQGAEMRVAETRAVNRALRKAYGIGICSVEEIGSLATPPLPHQSKKLPPQPANGNYGVPKVRNRLCQIIRQHQLDATLVKSYATDFCGVKSLREATREQVEMFVVHLADWAEKNRDGLLAELNSYMARKEKDGAA